MTLETFAQAHNLPGPWLELRRRCEDVVKQPDFWYRTDLRQQVSDFAVQASNILDQTLRETAPRGCDGSEPVVHPTPRKMTSV